MPSVLIADDEANIRKSLAGALSREGFAVETAGTLDQARSVLRESFDVVLLDVWFPEGSGLDLLAEIASSAPYTSVIVMSGHADIATAVKATQLGAYDFLEKPISLERLLVVLRNATATTALRSEIERLQADWPSPIIGESEAVRKLVQEIRKAAPSHARVLIQGENGTGKELVARALHAASPRSRMPFIAVNCSAIPEELAESELFGHERGAFTGATQSRRGRFEEAHGGTLFLDEVADLSPRAQTKLLRVLQEGEIVRVGGSRTIQVDVRVISASNRDLQTCVTAGTFREDLFFRLAVVPITAPPLRARRSDIPLLVRHFVESLASELGQRPRQFNRAALEALRHHAFPGNVRELRNVVERLLIMAPGNSIDATDVRAVLPTTSITGNHVRLSDAVRDFEKTQVEAALEAEDGNMTRVAARLGLERSHLYKKMRKLGLAGGRDVD